MNAVRPPASSVTRARVATPAINLHHGYERGGQEPVQTLLWGLCTWSAATPFRYTGRGLAETREGVLCDPCAHDAKLWSVVGCLQSMAFQFRLWTGRFDWPVIADDFVRDSCALLAGENSGLWPSQCLTHVDAHARRLNRDEIVAWVGAAFTARKRAVEDVINAEARARALAGKSAP